MYFEHVQHEFGEIHAVEKDGKRFYVTPDGERYPSVTTVLGSNPLKKSTIADWKNRVGQSKANQITKEAAGQGTTMHLMLEWYLSNNFDYHNQKVLRDYLKEHHLEDYNDHSFRHGQDLFHQLRPLIDVNIGKIHGLEVPLWSDFLRLAGRCDCIAEWNGKLSIIDFKTSMKSKKRDWIDNYFMQATAYACMFEDRVGIPVTQCVILIAQRTGHPQIFVEKRNDWLKPLMNEIDRYYLSNRED